MDMRDMRGMDGRRLPPRNARGEFRRRRSRRGDRGMPMRDMNYDGRMSYPNRDYGDMRGGDYAQNQMAYRDMRSDYRSNDMGDMARNDYGYDGHYGMHGGRHGGYEPVEFMGYCSGYYGSPEQDYARVGRRDYGYETRYGRDYGYPMYEHDYGYGDYGETLSDKELEEWCHKLKSQLTEQEKQMFSKESIVQRAKAMGKPMEGFGEKELEVATLMVFTDYKQTIGNNIDLAIKLAYDWLSDKDVKVKGAEKLAVYYDEIVMGGEDD